ncbi:MAG: serine/threonine-protein kinase [Planctomycetota bacterium]
MPQARPGIENSFGRIAIAQEWATPSQVEDALKAMRKLAELGFREKLGAVMVKKGYLTPDKVQEILRIQGSRARNRIKGYQIVSKLGQGGMGAVFKARQLSLDRLVALKVLAPHLAKDKGYVERFLREARAVARLNHPHIIQGIDVGDAEGQYYFAMEFVDGPTLKDVIESEGPLPEARALEVVAQIAEALEHARKNRLIHRDVKPDNIMIDRRGEAKLCDLGLAKFASGDSSSTNYDGEPMVVGTPHYISPEQAKGESKVDIRADIYSLGGTLFHALTGRTPFTGMSAAAIMSKHVTDLIDDPRQIKPGISEGAALLIAKMMAKKPADRYSDPEALLKDIRVVAKGGVPRELRAQRRPGIKLPASPSAAKSAPRPTVDVRRQRVSVRRARGPDVMPYIVAAVVLLLVIGVVLWFVT